jgi:hypothetical protein
MEGFDKVQALLIKLANKYGDDPKVSVIVGYTAAYAVHVHENIEMKWKGLPRQKPHKGNYWDPQGRGQAKFLEQPARELKREFSKIIVGACSNGAKLHQALMMAGLRLQRESQQLVPVDTGNLKASAFTRREL